MDRAVAEGVPGAPHAALGLGRMCQNKPNVHLHQGSGELRGAAPTPKLLGQAVGFPRRALEGAMLVAVEGSWHAVAGDDLPQHQQAAAEVLLFLDQGEGDLPGGAVHGTHEAQGGSPSLQPVVAAAVGLQQHPLLGQALPALIARGPPTATGPADAPGKQDPPHSGAGHLDARRLHQHLSQVQVVESGLAARGQRQYLRIRLWAGGGTRPFDSVSVSHVGHALRSIAAFNACILACFLVVNVNLQKTDISPEQMPTDGNFAQRHNEDRSLTP